MASDTGLVFTVCVTLLPWDFGPLPVNARVIWVHKLRHQRVKCVAGLYDGPETVAGLGFF